MLAGFGDRGSFDLCVRGSPFTLEEGRWEPLGGYLFIYDMGSVWPFKAPKSPLS